MAVCNCAAQVCSEMQHSECGGCGERNEMVWIGGGGLRCLFCGLSKEREM